MPWRSWISAVFMIVVIAVSAFIRKFENTEQCLTYVDTFVNSYVDLMQNRFFQLWFCDTVWRIVKWIVIQLGFAISNTLYYGEYSSQAAAPEVAVFTALVSTAPVSTAPVSTHYIGQYNELIFSGRMAQGPGLVVSRVQPADIIEDIEVIPFPCGPGVPAMAASAVQPNDTRTARERLAALKEARNGH